MSAMSFQLTKLNSALFLDPGLGKTSISLAVIKILKNVGKIKGTLLVAPLRVVYGVWPDEIAKWANFQGLTYTIVHGETKDTVWGDYDIYLINPESLKWLHGELLKGLKAGKSCPFNYLLVDESTKFKNHESSRFKYLVDMLPLFKRRSVMTGTPSPKSLLDLWSQIFLVDSGKCLGGNFHKFRNKHFESNDWDKYNWHIKDFADVEIQKAIAPITLNMNSIDYLDMPEVSYNKIEVELPKEAKTLYKQMERDFFAEIEGSEVSAEATAQSSMKCHQIANGVVYEDIPENLTEEEEKAFRRNRKELYVHSAKIEALKDLIDELNGKPLLIGYKFKHDLKALRKALGDIPYIGSGVTPKETQSLVREWNSGSISVLAGHPAAMGHGLNMQSGGNDICFFSLDWDLELYQQFVARIYRQGVKGKVRIHHIIAKETVDEAMMVRLGERASQQLSLREAITHYRKLKG